MDQYQPRGGFPFPVEITLEIFSYLELARDWWALSSTSSSLYEIAREHFLWKTVRLGWWPDETKYEAAIKDFDPKSDPNAKLKYDIGKVGEFGIASFIRDLSIAFADGGMCTSDVDYGRLLWEEDAHYDWELSTSLRELFSAAPDVFVVQVYGTQSFELYQETIELVAAACPRLRRLHLEWTWNYTKSEIAAVAAIFQGRFRELEELEIVMGVDRLGEWGEGRGYLGQRLAEPLIRACISSPKLQRLEVRLTNDTDDEGVDWPALLRCKEQDARLNLTSLEYSLQGTLQGNTTGMIGRTLQGMSGICKDLQSFTFRHDSDNEPLALNDLMPWFSNLAKCKKLALTIDIDLDPYSANAGRDKEPRELSTESHYTRQYLMRGLAQLMPAVRHVAWEDENDEYRLEFQLEMLVERDAEGAPYALGFRSVPASWSDNFRSDDSPYTYSRCDMPMIFLDLVGP